MATACNSRSVSWRVFVTSMNLLNTIYVREQANHSTRVPRDVSANTCHCTSNIAILKYFKTDEDERN